MDGCPQSGNQVAVGHERDRCDRRLRKHWWRAESVQTRPYGLLVRILLSARFATVVAI